MKTKVVILNGPPRSGKDTLTDAMISGFAWQGVPCHHLRFKTKLYDLVQCVYSITDSTMEVMKYNKEVPNTLLDDITFREALIKVSEEAIKPNYGQDYFGIAASKALQPGINIFSDGGFKDELNPLIQAVGKDNIIIVRLHRKGTSFMGDSRTYLYTEDTDVESFDFYNEHTIDTSTRKLVSSLHNFIYRK